MCCGLRLLCAEANGPDQIMNDRNRSSGLEAPFCDGGLVGQMPCEATRPVAARDGDEDWVHAVRELNHVRSEGGSDPGKEGRAIEASRPLHTPNGWSGGHMRDRSRARLGGASLDLAWLGCRGISPLIPTSELHDSGFAPAGDILATLPCPYPCLAVHSRTWALAKPGPAWLGSRRISPLITTSEPHDFSLAPAGDSLATLPCAGQL